MTVDEEDLSLCPLDNMARNISKLPLLLRLGIETQLWEEEIHSGDFRSPEHPIRTFASAKQTQKLTLGDFHPKSHAWSM